MKRINFIQMGDFDDSVIINLVAALNSRQDEFSFTFSIEDVIPHKEDPSREAIPTREVIPILQNFIRGRNTDEYFIAICSARLTDITYSDPRLAIVSLKGWATDFSRYSSNKVLAYGLIDPLMECFEINSPAHEKAHFCPNDLYYSDRATLEGGLQKAEICAECREILYNAYNHRKISVKEIAALYRIMDFIGDRKICFVLMPFKKDLDDVYNECIKPTLVEKHWECKRSDEVFGTRAVIDIIHEYIFRPDIIIADLSERNANVFYELGFSHAIGKNTILVTQALKDVPFDVGFLRLIEYGNNVQGLKKLSSELDAFIPAA